jgi:hypothetical protein
MMKRKKQGYWRRPIDPKSGKPYTELTTDELREATKEFDEPLVMERLSRPMSQKERAAYLAAIKGPKANAPRRGRRVLITVQPELLRRADAYAKRQGLTRSELFAHGLQALMGSAA